jgi:hypothetical protein
VRGSRGGFVTQLRTGRCGLGLKRPSELFKCLSLASSLLRLHLLCFSVPDYYAELSFPIGLSSVVT